MSTVELHPGDVYWQNSAVNPDWHGTLAGSGWWSDDSDATYVRLHVVDTAKDTTTGWLPLFTGAAISTLTLHVRVTVDSAVASAVPLSAELVADGVLPVSKAAFEFPSIPTGTAVWHDLTAEAELVFGYTLADLADQLSAASHAIHLTVDDAISSGETRDYFISEVWLEVGLQTSQAPPCQIYPRDDGLGAGGAAVWPPPSSGRPGSYY
jgi:hypothetical protein